jgi:hypothetical protein
MSKLKLNLVVDLLAYLAMVGLTATGLMMAYVLPPGSVGGGCALTLLGRSRHQWGTIHFYLAVALLGLVLLHLLLHWSWVTNTFGALLAAAKPKKAGAGAGGRFALLGLGAVTVAALVAPFTLPVTEGDRGEGHGAGTRGGRGKARQAEQDACATCPLASDEGGESACPSKSGEQGKGKGQPASGAAEPQTPGSGKKGEGAHGGEAIRGRTTVAEAAQYAGVSVERLLQELKLPASTPPDSLLASLREELGLSMPDLRAAIERLRTASAPK